MLLREPLSQDQAADLARILKALADPTRLRLVSMIAAHVGGEACVCDLPAPLGLTQPTIFPENTASALPREHRQRRPPPGRVPMHRLTIVVNSSASGEGRCA